MNDSVLFGCGNTINACMRALVCVRACMRAARLRARSFLRVRGWVIDRINVGI